MALLDLLTPDIIAERFYTLPEELQAVLEDPDNQREFQIICVTNGVGDPSELQNAEAIIAATVLGLTHMDDLGTTLAENLSLDRQISEKIAEEVRAKILEPFRKKIEGIYTPIIPGPKKTINIAPKPMPTPAPMPMAPTPVSDLKPAPASIPNQAWQPTRLTVPSAAPAAPTAPNAGAPAKPATPIVPAPFMMHQESSVAPLATGVDFKLNIPKDMFKSTPAKPIEIPRPPKMAELEIGKAPLPPKPAGPTSFRITPPSQARVVHYADLRTNITTGLSAAKPEQAMPIAPKPVAPTPIAQAPSIPTTTPAINTSPTPPAAPKVVNFGPEEVK